MCDFSSNQIGKFTSPLTLDNKLLVQSIQSEMRDNPTGFDPEYVFMNASLNVTSAFCLNESYDFGDSEQLKLLYWIETFFDKIADLFLINAFTSMFPTFMIRRDIPRAILTAFKPDRYMMRSIMYKEIIPFFCRKMKEHEDTIDPDSPRDYLDYLILEARVALCDLVLPLVHRLSCAHFFTCSLTLSSPRSLISPKGEKVNK